MHLFFFFLTLTLVSEEAFGMSPENQPFEKQIEGIQELLIDQASFFFVLFFLSFFYPEAMLYLQTLAIFKILAPFVNSNSTTEAIQDTQPQGVFHTNKSRKEKKQDKMKLSMWCF